MNVMIWTAVGIVLALVLFLVVSNGLIQRKVKQAGPDEVWQFVQNHAAGGRAALTVRLNGENIVNVNGDRRMPLASTVKIIVAIEYARQAADGRIDPEQEVRLEALRSFYVPKTDGGAHEAWLRSLQDTYPGGSVPLSEVAAGMIAYSSNANTDYLLQQLGLKNVNSVLSLFGLDQHEPVYPLASTLFVPVRWMNEQQWSKKKTIQAVAQMNAADYRQRSIDIFNQWENTPPTPEERKQMYGFMSLAYQRIWSDRLTRSTTDDYVSLLEKLNSKAFLPDEVHTFLDPVMEQIMKAPANQDWLVHGGKKGGSTAFVLTEAMYATAKDGTELALAFFTDKLNPIEQAKLSRSLNEFELALLRDGTFRDKTIEQLRSVNS